MKRTAPALGLLLILAVTGCGRPEGRSGKTDHRRPTPGGYLVVGMRAEPQTWNRILATDWASHEISERIHAALLRVNRITQEAEPELAESWSFSEDGRLLTFRLRAGVRFSDGSPFTAEDVAFTFRAIHDPKVASPLVETARVDDVPLRPEVVDSLTVRFKLPRRTAVVERLFDSLYILPRHRLEASLAAGSFASEYGMGAPVGRIVGLGPFVPQSYTPGQRVVLRRNPHYWKVGPGGVRLPFLNGIIFAVLTDANALTLRFRKGELDILSQIAPQDFVSLRASGRSDIRLLDLGPGMAPERLWFNLNPRSQFVPPEKRAWFAEERFRQAVSLAIDRASIANGIYLGLASAAAGPVTPANWIWKNKAIQPPRFDPAAAREVFAQAGFRIDGKGALRDREGHRVQFSLLTNAGNPLRGQIGALIQEDLSQIGIDMSLVTLDFATLLGRISRSFDYEACLLAIAQTDPDPSAELPLWLSRSPHHVWNPLQRRPATHWEARLDELMQQQMLALDPAKRKLLFDEVQAIVANHFPVIDLVVPHALVGVNRRVGNLKLTPFWHPTLWNSEELYLKDVGEKPHPTSM